MSSFIDGENSETDSHLSAPPAEVAFYKMWDRNQSCSPDSSSHPGGMVPAGFQESQQFSLLQGSLGAQFAGLSIINVRRERSSGGIPYKSPLQLGLEQPIYIHLGLHPKKNFPLFKEGLFFLKFGHI